MSETSNTAKETHRKPVYSFHWAAGVVKSLEEAYPRATEVLYTFWDLTPEKLAAFLVYDDPLWIELRKAVKILHAWMIKEKLDWPDYSTLHTFYWMLLRRGVTRMAERLTGNKNYRMLEEQCLKQGVGEASGITRTLPSNLYLEGLQLALFPEVSNEDNPQ
jgi:hypothetical protein